MANDERIRRVLSAIDERPTAATCLVAIDGASSAGKTTLAEHILNHRPSYSIVHVDDFYRHIDSEAMANLTPEQGYHRHFEWERLRDEVLHPLLQGRTCRFRRFDWEKMQPGKWAEVTPRDVVMIEGVYSFRPEIRQFYSFAIFVDLPRDIRLRRSLNRAPAGFGPVRKEEHRLWLESWMAAEDWYLENIRTIESADLVVSGDDV